MVAPAKAASDFGIGTRRKFLRQIHRDLARAGDRADAALRRHLGLVEPVVRAHRALDLVDRDARTRATDIFGEPVLGEREIDRRPGERRIGERSEEHTSELQSLMRISYAVFCLKKKTTYTQQQHNIID